VVCQVILDESFLQVQVKYTKHIFLKFFKEIFWEKKMRRNAITSAVQEESDEINLTPMLDVVFIMLIFFIVTANFIKEPGLEINRPDSDTAETQENAAILIAVGPTGEVWMDGRRIDVRQVKANVVKLLADNPKGSVVIQADEKAMADTIIQVMDGAREAGVNAISLASEPK
jgi:biopolymer transport protein ExbD